MALRQEDNVGCVTAIFVLSFTLACDHTSAPQAVTLEPHQIIQRIGGPARAANEPCLLDCPSKDPLS